MHGREHHVAGICRLAGNAGRFSIANFANHHDVGVLTQHASQRAGEGLVGLRVDLDLRDIRHLVLDRIFDRDDVVLHRVDVVQTRVERRRLTGTSRPAAEEQAVWLVNDRLDLLLQLLSHPQLRERADGVCLVENTDDHLLAVPGSLRRNTKVDFASFDDRPEPAVL